MGGLIWTILSSENNLFFRNACTTHSEGELTDTTRRIISKYLFESFETTTIYVCNPRCSKLAWSKLNTPLVPVESRYDGMWFPGPSSRPICSRSQLRKITFFWQEEWDEFVLLWSAEKTGYGY